MRKRILLPALSRNRLVFGIITFYGVLKSCDPAMAGTNGIANFSSDNPLLNAGYFQLVEIYP
ncbi:MAG: hypothetical protein IPL12_09510 [Bacteroidetes bacterium]|nr:hypothetical protein [Bacteroidota bacterium]